MTILAAVDGDRRPDRTVSVGYDLATAYDDPLVALHVMEDEEFEARQVDSAVDGEATYFLDHATGDASEVAAAVVEESLDGPDDRVTALGDVGDPTAAILAAADRRDARFVVVGGRKRTPVGKALFGSHTQSILLHADRPVVTVMDEG